MSNGHENCEYAEYLADVDVSGFFVSGEVDEIEGCHWRGLYGRESDWKLKGLT
jgi:hypothetical protein